MRVVILGAGGFGREVADLIEQCNRQGGLYEFEGWIVDSKYGDPGTIINGKPILGDLDWLCRNGSGGRLAALLGVGSGALRKKWATACEAAGVEIASAIHPTVEISKTAVIGKGLVACRLVGIMCNSVIGDYCQLNVFSHVAHDCKFGDYSTTAMGVRIPGYVTVEEGVYFGSGVDFVPPLTIGKWATIGAGAVILKDVLPGTTVVGNPGRIVKQREV